MMIRKRFVLEFSGGFMWCVLSISDAVCHKYDWRLQVFLEKYGYLHQENHIHNAVEVQSAVRWVTQLFFIFAQVFSQKKPYDFRTKWYVFVSLYTLLIGVGWLCWVFSSGGRVELRVGRASGLNASAGQLNTPSPLHRETSPEPSLNHAGIPRTSPSGPYIDCTISKLNEELSSCWNLTLNCVVDSRIMCQNVRL